MLQLVNASPFEAQIALFPDKDGIDTLYLVVKGTFAIGEDLAIAEDQVPPTLTDAYWGEPGQSSIKYASDLHLAKPSTDVVLVGHAWAPEGKMVSHIDVSIAIANRRKVVRVFGDRVWRSNGTAFTPPEPFESLPLVYERAYGGVHRIDPKRESVLGEERNPVGLGFRGKRKVGEANGLPLPNIEDPENLIRRWGDQATPQGFGFIAPNWLPRRDYAGTYDEAWQKTRAPYLPEDFDARFFNAAHPDLILDDHLQGGEPIQVMGVSPRGRLQFRLPVCRLDSKVRIAGSTESLPLNLETVLIEPDDERVCLAWRGAVSCNKRVLKVEEVSVSLAGLDVSGGTA